MAYWIDEYVHINGRKRNQMNALLHTNTPALAVLVVRWKFQEIIELTIKQNDRMMILMLIEWPQIMRFAYFQWKIKLNVAIVLAHRHS